MRKLTKNDIRHLLSLYMEEHNLSFIGVNATLSIDGQKITMSVTEDEIHDELD